MIDRSISKPYRWKVKSRLAVLEYADVPRHQARGYPIWPRSQDHPGLANPGARGRAGGPGPALPRAPRTDGSPPRSSSSSRRPGATCSTARAGPVFG